MPFRELPLPAKIFVVLMLTLFAVGTVWSANRPTTAAHAANAAVATPAKQPVGKAKTDLVTSFDRRQALVRNAVGCSAPKDRGTIAACNCVVPILAGHITEADLANPTTKDRRFNDMLFSTVLACRKQLQLN